MHQEMHGMFQAMQGVYISIDTRSPEVWNIEGGRRNIGVHMTI
jgi:hypothetical protein